MTAALRVAVTLFVSLQAISRRQHFKTNVTNKFRTFCVGASVNVQCPFIFKPQPTVRAIENFPMLAPVFTLVVLFQVVSFNAENVSCVKMKMSNFLYKTHFE
jgi:hypothetical protein